MTVRLSITVKLFLAILATNIAIAAAFGIANQISIDRGFRAFVKEHEQRRLDNIADALAGAYVERGRTWDFLRGDELGWQQLATHAGHRGSPIAKDGRAPTATDAAASSDVAPVRFPSTDADGAPWAAPARNAAPPDRAHTDRPPRGPAGFPRITPPQVSLLDERRVVVAGPAIRQRSPTLTRPVLVDGAAVGWVLAQASQFAGSDERFLDQQLQTSWMIGVLAVLVAAVVAIVMSRGFLAPIRRLAAATHRLAAGDYDQRVTSRSRDELGQLVDDFNQLAIKLRGTEEARRALLADISHELRTPLAVLHGELEALQDGMRAPDPDAIASLQAEVATLGALVDDLYELAIADLGGANYEREPVDVAGLARSTVQAFSRRLAERGLAVDSERISAAPVVVSGDARRLTQVLNNLLENSTRYTDPGGVVEVTVKASRTTASLEVQDSAPGVPREAMRHVFDRLFRVDRSRSRERGGAGLGLSLCRSIVEAHGGTIAAEPAALGGLHVRVTLPLAS